MGNLLPLSILFTFWLIVSVFLYLGLKSSLGKKYTNEELLLPQPKTETEKFPKWYSFFYGLGLILFFLSWVSSILAFPVVTFLVQKVLYASNTPVFISPNTMFASLGPSLFFGIPLFGFILKIIYSFFPRFDQFATLKDRINRNTLGLSKDKKRKKWEDALLKVNTQKLAKSEWRQLFSWGLLVWLLVGPFYILAMDNYYKFTNDGLMVNPYLSLVESRYEWKDISSAKIYATISKTSGGELSLNPKFEIITKNGKQIDLLEGVGLGVVSELFTEELAGELVAAADMLHSRGIIIDFQPLTEEKKKVLLRSDKAWQSTVNAVFGHLEQRK